MRTMHLAWLPFLLALSTCAPSDPLLWDTVLIRIEGRPVPEAMMGDRMSIQLDLGDCIHGFYSDNPNVRDLTSPGSEYNVANDAWRDLCRDEAGYLACEMMSDPRPAGRHQIQSMILQEADVSDKLVEVGIFPTAERTGCDAVVSVAFPNPEDTVNIESQDCVEEVIVPDTVVGSRDPIVVRLGQCAP